MFGIRIGIFLSFVAVLVIGRPAEAQNAAKVLSAQGTVDREQPPWVPLTVNVWLPVGAKVRTGNQSRAVLLLTDETQLKLNANTEVQLANVREASTLLTRVALSASRSQESVLNMSKGQVWLRARNKPADVKVATPAVTAAIRGTEFDLRVGDDGESIITVLEGAVDYRNAFGAVQVNTGEQGRARVGEAPTKTVLLNPADAVQWTLVYSGAVSPRDYPVRYPSVAAARAAIATAAPGLATAEARHDAGDLAGALQALDGLGTPGAAELRGWILLEQNRPAEALAAFAAALPDSPRTRLGQSMAAYRLRRFPDAYRAVETGGDTRLAVQKAQLELLSGDAAAARQTLEAVPPADPVYAQARALLSNVYLIQDRKDDARRAAEAAVAAAPDSPTAYLAVSLVEQSIFDLPAATRAARRARSLNPSFVQADIQYANLLFGAGDTSGAQRTILRVLAEAPGEAMAHSTLGFIQLSRGHNVEAQASLNMALSLDDTQGEPHLGLGILAMREGRHEDAVAEFLTAAALEPRRSLYQTYLGKALYELRRFDQSFTSLASAEQLDPRDPTPHLYAGVFQNDLLRPGAAVREFEQSIALNDGRAVYRSRFLLDQDLASRNVNLATAYGQLGLAEWANHHALESEAASVDDSSAHLFLAGTFLNLKGRVNAGGGELLMSRLLSAPNVNTFNTLNSYTTLFDRPRADWGVTQSVGTFKSSDSEVSAYGGTSQLAYSAVWGYFRSDGFRPLNDDRHDWSGANLFKVALTPHSSLLLSYVHFNTQQGNHGGGLSSLVDDENNPVKRLTSSLDRGEVGYHMQFRPGSDLLVYFAAQVDQGVQDDPQATFGFLHTTSTLRTPAYDYQMSHLFKVSRLQLRYGVDLYRGTERSDVNSNLILPLDPPIEVPYSSTSTTTDIQYRTLFAEATYPVSRHLAATFGINYDWANHDDFFLESPQSTGKWNPSAGLSFSPTSSTTLRVALMHVLQTHYMDRIVPTHVSGFPLEQNESPMSESIGYNVGWDQRFGPDTFLRTTAFTRRRLIPLSDDLCGFVSCDNQFYGGGIVLNRMLTERWTVVPEYTLTHTTDIFGARHEHEGTIRTVYVHPNGLAFRVGENYFHQRGSTFTGDAANVAVFTTNASISYALPRKRGTVYVAVSNLTDRRYAFLADPLALDPRVPRRQASLGLQLYF